MEANRTTATRPNRRARRAGAAALAGALLASAGLALAPPAPAGAEAQLPVGVRMVSRDDSGAAIKAPTYDPAISGNGRFVAFTTNAAVVPADTNGKPDVYVRDLWAATIELVSVSDSEAPIGGESEDPSISDDGRYVAFLTAAPGLVPGDAKGFRDVFVRDRYAGTTVHASPGTGGQVLTTEVPLARISGNGRYVTFVTNATNAIAGDTNGDSDVFVRDLQAKTTERASISPFEQQGEGSSTNATISDDGRYVAFDSQALLAGGVAGETNVYVRDRTAGTTIIANVRSDETLPDSGAGQPVISGDGTKVTFASDATNLVSGDGNGAYDAFVRDLVAGTTVRYGLSSTGAELPQGSSPVPGGMDDDGSHLLFSTLSNAGPGADAGNDYDVYLRTGSTTARVTTGPSLADPAENNLFASIDDAGGAIAFRMQAKLTADASFDQTYLRSGPGIGPAGGLQGAIAQLYSDFLGRPATSAEMSTWSARINAGSADLATLGAQLAADPAYTATRAPLIRLYWAFFLRRPDPSGLTYWLGRYQAGQSLTKIAQSFAASSEFTNRYGNVSNQQYVKLVYQNVFERQPDASGLAYWTGKLDRKEISRGGVIVQFSESSEGKRRLAGPTNITLVTLAMLRTVPSAGTWDLLYPTIDAGEKQAAWIVKQLLRSALYENRFD